MVSVNTEEQIQEHGDDQVKQTKPHFSICSCDGRARARARGLLDNICMSNLYF